MKQYPKEDNQGDCIQNLRFISESIRKKIDSMIYGNN